MHCAVQSQLGGIVFQLLLQISRLKTRQSGDADLVARAVEAMATETGVGRAATAPAHRNGLSVGRKRVLARRGRLAGDQQACEGQDEDG